MGDGIRPKDAFPYACLRSKDYPRPPCFGKNCHSCPEDGLCDRCAHLDDCKKEFYKR